MRPVSPDQLRHELHARSRARTGVPVEVAWTRSASVVFAAAEDGSVQHGNFLPASYRRICADPAWAQRLQKTYTGSCYLPRAGDRRRGELECASSSDALLMNIFCFPGVLRRAALCSLLGIPSGVRPEFGVRAHLPMRRSEIDRTELDMQLGQIIVEAKLTEGGFGRASRERLMRYTGVEELFNVDLLPRTGQGISGYQLVRGLLAASLRDSTYLVLLDARRQDLHELCARVLGAAHTSVVRHRLRLRTWQEVAATLPLALRTFLREKYGIHPATHPE